MPGMNKAMSPDAQYATPMSKQPTGPVADPKMKLLKNALQKTKMKGMQ
jgi:hypothetical protein